MPHIAERMESQPKNRRQPKFLTRFASNVGGYQRLSWATILKEPQHIPGAYARHPQPQNERNYYKLLVGDRGYVPLVCSNILRLMLWLPSQHALQWFEDSPQVMEYAEFLGMDLKTEMFGAPAKMPHFLTLVVDFPFWKSFLKQQKQRLICSFKTFNKN